MSAVHSAGVIHRGLTSFNILLTHEYAARVASFDVASEAQECWDKVPAGCHMWAAPEMVLR